MLPSLRPAMSWVRSSGFMAVLAVKTYILSQEAGRAGLACRRAGGLSRLRQFEFQCVSMAMSYTPPMTRNSSSPFSTPGNRSQLKKTLGVGTSAVTM